MQIHGNINPWVVKYKNQSMFGQQLPTARCQLASTAGSIVGNGFPAAIALRYPACWQTLGLPQLLLLTPIGQTKAND
jgi:hypothetical protein